MSTVGRLGAAVLVCAGLALTGSSHALMAGAAPDSPAARIDPNTGASAWTAAVSISIGSGVYSGVVVAPRFVLTAAHVAAGSAPAAVSVQINVSATPVVIGARAISIFPSADFPYDDLALIELSSAVPANVHIPPVYAAPLPSGQVVTLVGYGSSGYGDAGPTVGGLAGVKRTGRNVVDAVTTTVDSSGRSSLFYLFDFDGAQGNGLIGGADARQCGRDRPLVRRFRQPRLRDDPWPDLAGGHRQHRSHAQCGAADFRFGTGGGGILLSDPRFIEWLQAQTGRLGDPGASEGDIPVPSWALAALATLLAWPLMARRGRRLTSYESPGSRS